MHAEDGTRHPPFPATTIHVLTAEDPAWFAALPVVFGDAAFACAQLEIDAWGVQPDPTGVLVLARWATRRAADAITHDPEWGGCREAWHAVLRPSRSAGTLHGADPLAGCSGRRRGDERRPGLFVTWANFPNRWAPTFAALRADAIADQRASPGARCGFGAALLGPERFRGFTVTCWESVAAGLDFAYRGAPHRAARQWFEQDVLGASSGAAEQPESWFGRFVVDASIGTVGGVSPMPLSVSAPAPVR